MPVDQSPSRILSPTLQDLEKIVGIDDLNTAITRFVDPSRAKNGPDNVAYIYLVVCEAFQSQGIVSVNAMPSFDITYREQTYTVSAVDKVSTIF
jgi:hypothetical protein